MAENLKLKLHTGVSVALHPDCLAPRAPALTGRSASALALGQNILHGFYLTQSLILNAREAEYAKERTPANLAALQRARDGKQRPASNMIMKGGKIELALNPTSAKNFNETASLAFKRTAVNYDNARKKITAELDELLSERASLTTDPNAKTAAGIAAAAEIRAHLKSLANSERVALIREQISQGNARVASAVAESEPFLSGLDPKTHANLVAETHKKFAPEETTKIEAVSAVLKCVDDAASIAVKAYGDSLVPVVGLDAAADAALSALKTGG
jgi:hypothetical protein